MVRLDHHLGYLLRTSSLVNHSLHRCQDKVLLLILSSGLWRLDGGG